MSAEESPYSPAWLGLREPADGAARSPELLDRVRDLLAGQPRPLIRDLGCGTGSMGRWLAARLPGPQHWILYDRDPELLQHALATMVTSAADGSPVTVETRQCDIGGLTGPDLAGAALVTASALLDVLTGEEVSALAGACAAARVPALLTLSVTGHVDLLPTDPLDAEIGAAFNDHQRREDGGRRLLGPAATDTAAEAFERLGGTVLVRPSPWRLGPDQSALTARWLRGWVAAALDQRPDLADRVANGYLGRRLAAAEAGELTVEVGHSDLFAKFE
nr:class I SAM-dependent methyltransferase [Micromonospora sp. DSM 115978]